ncbi:HAD family hydrolase [Bacillus carboniphilus]|uniref:HAD family hydrolase n=1 Tax=Bacillus carboniphilus TaxID=86663 RepID=A0ABP3GGE6_9BACI
MGNRMIKSVLFDFDGTLVDSKKVFINVFNKLADKYKFDKLKWDDVEAIRKMPIIERAKKLNFPMHKLPLMANDFSRHFKQNMNQVLLVDGIRQLLSDLKKKGYMIAIISSNDEKNIRQFLQAHQINQIDEIMCSSLIFGKDKMIKKYLKSNRLSPNEVIYVGDEARDIVACRKSGIQVIWVEWGYDAKELIEKEKPDFMVEVPGDILRIV